MAEKHSKTFHLKNGKTFTNVKGFAKHLGDMGKDVYEHHVNDKKNDFHNWLKNSMSKEDLAKKVSGKIDKIELELHVLRDLLFESSDEKKSKTSKKKEPSKKKESAKKKADSKTTKKSKK